MTHPRSSLSRICSSLFTGLFATLLVGSAATGCIQSTDNDETIGRMDSESPALIEENADLASIEGLMQHPEAKSLRRWLERQEYSMVDSKLDATERGEAYAMIRFAKDSSAAGLFGAAIVFRLSETNEVLDVAAVVSPHDNQARADHSSTCASPTIYHSTNNLVGETPLPASPDACQVGIFGCGYCTPAGSCAGQWRESYYWSIRFNTCDPCSGGSPNGCCGCLPGYPCK